MEILFCSNNECEKSEFKRVFESNYKNFGFKILEGLSDAIALIDTKFVNVVLFDLNINSIKELKEVRRAKLKRPKVIFVAICNSEENISDINIERFGVDYVFYRPFNTINIVEKVKELATIDEKAIEKLRMYEKNSLIEKLVSDIIIKSGILPNLKGYKYLKDSILLGYNDGDLLDSITKVLYTNVASVNRCSKDGVERAIRNAIDLAWDRYNGNNFYNMLGMDKIYSNKKPTNSEYICSVIEYLNMLVL